MPRSLKSEAERLLGRMSHRGRDLYELQYGARARQMLTDAAAAGDAAALAEVSRRFFHTRAGGEATFLLGLYHLDHGRPLAGALALARLKEVSPAAEQFEPALSLAMTVCWIRAGRSEKAGQTLLVLQERYPEATVQIAGDEILRFRQKADMLDWLSGLLGPQGPLGVAGPAQWAMFRGNAARNASRAGDGPLLTVRWRVPVSSHPVVEALIEQVHLADREWDRPALSTLHPLVVDDVVLMRTARNLLAVDFATGKRLWDVPVDDPFDTLIDPPSNSQYRRTLQLEYALRLRMWADATYGTISSDGQRVFAVEDLGLEIGRMRLHAVFFDGRGSEDPAGPKPYNRLAAYDVESGKLQWHVGGSPDEFGLSQAGTFFLGPPLPLMGRLYAIAETMGEIRLVVLDGKTGERIWSQQLAASDQVLLKDPLRRMAGVSPSYADGVLVCPTSNRSVVAVDPATQSLLWAYSYRRADGRSEEQAMFFAARSMMDPDPIGRWVDSSVVLADGCVLVTPVESDYLHCLNLLDGQLLWKEPRDDNLYLACAHEGKAVLVGRRHVRALDLHKTLDKAAKPPSEEPIDDGPGRDFNDPFSEPLDEEGDYQRPAAAWDGRTVEFPSGGAPSGTGFLSGDLYYVPLSTGEVMAVDLNTGRPVRVARSRLGNVPGNLVTYGGKILSQDATGLEAFDQFEALRREADRRLDASGDDAEALALKGEILWDEGKLTEAIECFRGSLSLQPEPNTRRLLRDALFDGLRVQFAVGRRDVDEIRQLIDQPEEQATFLRLMAVGLAEAGEFRAAWEHYAKLIDLDRDHRGMEQIDKSLSLRRDRWIRGQLASLYEAAPAEVKAQIDSIAESELKGAVEEGSLEAVERFLDYFGAQPIAAEARRHLAIESQKSGLSQKLFAAELLLRRQERSGNPELRARAVAELAEMLRRSGCSPDAAIYYDRLERELADVVCLDGKTGRELVESLPADDPVRDRLRSSLKWPEGKVVVTKSKPKTAPAPTNNQAPLAFDGDRGPFFSEMTVEFDQTPNHRLVACDGLGNQQWHLPLTELTREENFLLNHAMMRVSACGHLLFLTNGQRMLAVDTLQITEAGSPRVLWSRDLDEPSVDPSGRGRLRVQLADLAGGAPEFRLARYARDPISVPRIVSEEVVCFKRFRNLVAVDPSTGETLWVRRNIPNNAEVFGDREHVLIASPGETTATVLRTLDGHVLGQREVPAEREETCGRRVLVWRDADGHRLLEMVDPWERRESWPPREFAADATLIRVAHDAVAVSEPDGRLVLLDLDDGRTLLDAKLDFEPSLSDLSEILVLPSPDQYLVIAYNQTSRQTRAVQGVSGSSLRIERGRVYAFDRHGEKLWPAPAEIEDQWLPMSQPARLPVLTFANIVQQSGANAQTRSKTSILCIDKRTGRKICRDEFAGPTNCFRLVGDPEKKTVELKLKQSTITMDFTDQPLGADSEEDDAAAMEKQSPGPLSKGPAAARAIWKALQAAAGETPAGSNHP
ncbi:MAG: PQQ-binding-like beta-propeller repeat protein [Planctomycetota bacterium]